MPPSLGSEALPLFPRIVSEDGFMSMDSLLLQSGGHGRCQWLTTLFGVYLWAVHGAQVMSFVFIGKDVEGEFVGDSSLLRLTGTFCFIGWMCGLNLWGWLAAGPRSAVWTTGRGDGGARLFTAIIGPQKSSSWSRGFSLRACLAEPQPRRSRAIEPETILERLVRPTCRRSS